MSMEYERMSRDDKECFVRAFTDEITLCRLLSTRQEDTFLKKFRELKSEINVNFVSPFHSRNWTMLHIACSKEMPKAASELLAQSEIFYDCYDMIGYTPLDVSFEKKSVECLGILFKYVIAQLNLKNEKKPNAFRPIRKRKNETLDDYKERLVDMFNFLKNNKNKNDVDVCIVDSHNDDEENEAMARPLQEGIHDGYPWYMSDDDGFENFNENVNMLFERPPQ